MPDIDGDNGAEKSSLCMFLTSVHDGNSEGLIMHATEIARSRDCVNLVRNLEIGMQFPDSENALRNLEIAQIPRLCGTYTYIN